MTRADHHSGTDRLAEVAAALPCRHRRQRAGRRAVARSGASSMRSSRRSSPIRCWRWPPPAARFANAAEFTNPNVGEGGARRGRGRALYFSARRCRGRTRRRTCAPPAARVHIGLYAYRRDDAAAPGRACRPRTLERLEALEQLRALDARHRHSRRGDRLRLARRRHRRGPRTGPAADAGRRRGFETDHGTERSTDQVHFRHRRRCLLAGQGAGRGLDRRAARGPRLQGDAAEVRSLHQRRSRDDEPVPARRGLRHRRRRGDRPRPRATTSASRT